MITHRYYFPILMLLVGVSCSPTVPQIAKDLQSATSVQEQNRILARIATNEHERQELLSFMDSRRNDLTGLLESQLLQLSRQNPVALSAMPGKLNDTSQSVPVEKHSAIGYAFSSPWPNMAKAEHYENEWLVLEDNHGRVIMFSKAHSTNTFDAFVSKELPRYSMDVSWIKSLGFPDNSYVDGIMLYRQILETTASSPVDASSARDSYRKYALLAMKSMLLSGYGEPYISELQAGTMQGYQLFDATRPNRYRIILFDKHHESIEIVFGFRRSREESPINQSDVNCVIQSLERK